jgi:hypothetical protein
MTGRYLDASKIVKYFRLFVDNFVNLRLSRDRNWNFHFEKSGASRSLTEAHVIMVGEGKAKRWLRPTMAAFPNQAGKMAKPAY